MISATCVDRNKICETKCKKNCLVWQLLCGAKSQNLRLGMFLEVNPLWEQLFKGNNLFLNFRWSSSEPLVPRTTCMPKLAPFWLVSWKSCQSLSWWCLAWLRVCCTLTPLPAQTIRAVKPVVAINLAAPIMHIPSKMSHTSSYVWVCKFKGFVYKL